MLGTRILGELDNARTCAEADRGIRVEPYSPPRCSAGKQMAVEVFEEGQSPTIIYLNTGSASAFFARNPHLVKDECATEVIAKVKELEEKRLAIISQQFDLVCERFKDYLPKKFDIILKKVQKKDPDAFKRLLQKYPNINFLRPCEKTDLAERLLTLYKKYSSFQDDIRKNYPTVVFTKDGNPDFYA